MNTLIANQDADQIVRFIERKLEDDVMAVSALVNNLKQSNIKPNTLGDICRRLLPNFAKYRGVLDAAEADLREIYSECLQAQGLYAEAADQLAQADAFASSCPRLLQIADLYLEAGDSVSAETFIHKAGYKLPSEAANPVVKLRYTLAYARVLDSKLRPLEALHKYLEVLRNPDLSLDDKAAITQKAVVCAATTGNHRLTPSLRSALKHELANIARGLQLFANKIVHGEYIDDISEVSALLEAHHLATTANGKTVFTNALIEHNVRAIAHASETVSIDELAAKLNLPETEVFETVMKMASDKKIAALIDQENGTVHFPAPEVSENERIRAFCERVEAAEKKAALLLRAQNI